MLFKTNSVILCGAHQQKCVFTPHAKLNRIFLSYPFEFVCVLNVQMSVNNCGIIKSQNILLSYYLMWYAQNIFQISQKWHLHSSTKKKSVHTTHTNFSCIKCIYTAILLFDFTLNCFYELDALQCEHILPIQSKWIGTNMNKLRWM